MATPIADSLHRNRQSSNNSTGTTGQELPGGNGQTGGVTRVANTWMATRTCQTPGRGGSFN